MVMPFTESVRSAFGGGTKLSAEDGFLQFMIERLFASDAPEEEDQMMKSRKKSGDDMKLTSIQSITDFMTLRGTYTCRITFVSGQEETLQLHVLTRCLRRSAATHREHFLS